MSEEDSLLGYYERELTYLRKMGTEFARKYPKVAGRLELGADESTDPYVERLMESFAFLTGRIQYNLAEEFPQITTGLLNILYPHYLNPVPSMSVARFVPDPTQGKLTSGYVIPKHTRLFAESQQGHAVKFRTCYPETLWPIDVAYAAIEPTDNFPFLDAAADVASVLKVRLIFVKGTPKELTIPSLRFYLNGEDKVVNELYQIIFSQVTRVGVLAQSREMPEYLPEGSVQPVGFGPDEEVLPYPKHAHPQYRLLQEYFAFPDKFLFVDVNNLNIAAGTTAFDLLFLMKSAPAGNLPMDQNTFCLGCTPVVNLYPKTTEPIRLTHRMTEYPLVPDARRESSTEIYSITSVTSSSNSKIEGTAVEPFFSFRHHGEHRPTEAFWYARRTQSEKRDLPGSEMYLSLVDLNFRPRLPATQTVFAHTLCTNRHLANQLPAGAKLYAEESIPASLIYCITKPTPQIDPPKSGSFLWRLVSHLSLNFLSMSNGEESLRALKEILELYSSYRDRSRHHQISGIRSMSTRKVVRRIGPDAWRGFCQGTEITLSFDDEMYVGNSGFLLASVLNHFFALYSSINSFTQLVATSSKQNMVWKKWEPMVGEQSTL